MPSSFVDHALLDLLGVERKNTSETKIAPKPPSTKMMITFMSRAFKRCTQDAKLVIIALDDLHHADEFSWKVIQDLFETAQNVLVIATMYPRDSCDLKVDGGFWRDLNENHRMSKRFVTMALGCLDREEITSMIMKTLGLQRKEVKDDILEGIAIQSGGMPHFVNEILDHVKRQSAVDPDFEMIDVSETITLVTHFATP
jgi:predicted ATPase